MDRRNNLAIGEWYKLLAVLTFSVRRTRIKCKVWTSCRLAVFTRLIGAFVCTVCVMFFFAVSASMLIMFGFLDPYAIFCV